MSIKLMTRVWDETRFRGTQLLVLLALADHANDDGTCWPAYARIAKRARCSRRQAIRHVERLIAEGWVHKVGRKAVEHGFVNILKVMPSPRLPTGDADDTPFDGVIPDTGDILSGRGDI